MKIAHILRMSSRGRIHIGDLGGGGRHRDSSALVVLWRSMGDLRRGGDEAGVLVLWCKCGFVVAEEPDSRGLSEKLSGTSFFLETCECHAEVKSG